MEIGIAVGSLVLTPIVGEIKERIKSTLEKKLSKTLKGKLQDLERKMEAIHCVHETEELSWTLLANDKWQQRIREVISDAEDWLDDFEIEELRSGRTSRKVRRRTPKLSRSKYPVHYTKGVVKEILGDLNNTLESIEKAVANEKWAARDSHCHFNGQELIGRRYEIEKIVEFLLSENNNDNNNTCSIVGMGGVGKTALAQVICQHGHVKKKLVVKWAHVGIKKFDLKKILVRIGGKVETNNPLEKEIKILEESLGKKSPYLFVLDDLWDFSQVDWKRLKSMLLNINKGNKFLITTRNQRIAEIAAGKDKTVFLKPLEPAECLPLIQMFVESDALSSPTIKEEIIKECEGVPLAAITLGIKLSERIIRGGEIWSTEDVEEHGNIMNSLKFSYDYLPPRLKDCLAYHVVCNDILNKERLTQMWTAQGLIEGPDDGNTAFEELKNASFFYDVTEDIFGGTQFKVLKLFRSLIHLVSKEYADTTLSRITDVTRHVSLSPQRHAQEVQESRLLGQLRTVVGLPEIRLLAQFKGLRVLVLVDVEFESKDISFGNLKHLRYLDLSRNGNLEVLPESLGELLLLRTLRVDMCEKLKALLPNDINKLTKLRYLKARKMSYFTKLETLEILDCPRLRFLETDMENLKNLKRLAIMKHPDLTNLPEGFCSLTSLEMLSIEDCPRLESSLSTVEGLNILPDNLKSLRMKRSAELTEIYKRGEGRDDVSWIKEVYRNGILINPVPNVEPSPSSSSGETDVLTGTTEVEKPVREEATTPATPMTHDEREPQRKGKFHEVRERDKDNEIHLMNKDENEVSRKQTQAQTRIKKKTESRIVKLGEEVGIKDRKKKIEAFFQEESGYKLSTLFIGGITDAENETVQSRCNDVQDKFEFFERVLVPGEEFNLTRIVEVILGEKVQGLPLEQLRIKLQDNLHKKKFLIRLDVLYGMNTYVYDKLEVLLRKNGKVGNKLLITTRDKQVRPSIAHKEIKNSSDGSEILKLSFKKLSTDKKKCLLYSTCFTLHPPERGRLTQQWIAHDLFEASENIRNLEHLAREYFDDLLSRSFFYNLVEDDLMAEARFEVNDLVYELALSEGERCITSSDKIEEIPSTVLHLVFTNKSENFPSLRKLEKLRTFKWENFGLSSATSVTKLDMGILSSSLCVLDLSGSEFEKLPSSIGELRNLRYLDVSYNIYLDKLPNSLFELSNLETLRFEECGILELPRKFSKLKKLRNLYACTEQVSIPEKVIRGLASLRILHLNPVHNLETLPKSLENLTALETLVLRLCSRLTLSDTDIKGLKSLQNLTITHIKNEESLLIPSSLKDDAASSLSSLCLYYCMGSTTFPEWLVNLQDLRRLHVEFCPNLNPSPKGIFLPKCLEYLSIRGCPELTKICESEDWQQKNEDIREIYLDGRIIRSISNTRSSDAMSRSAVHVNKDIWDKGKSTDVRSSNLPSSSSGPVEEINEGEAMIQSIPQVESYKPSASSSGLITHDRQRQDLELVGKDSQLTINIKDQPGGSRNLFARVGSWVNVHTGPSFKIFLSLRGKRKSRLRRRRPTTSGEGMKSALSEEESEKCFQLCSLFPEDSDIPVECIVRYAMGMGLIGDATPMSQVRARVNAALKALTEHFYLSESTSQSFRMGRRGKKFARSAADEREHKSFIQTRPDLYEWPRSKLMHQFTYISLMENIIQELPEKLECPRLRLLSLLGSIGLRYIPDSCFRGTTMLRVLDLSASKYSNTTFSLPKSLECLESLRSLSLDYCHLAGDLSVIGNLSKLEILSLRDSNITNLPVEIGRLNKLRLLDLEDCAKLESIPAKEISKLLELEELYMKGGFKNWEVLKGGTAVSDDDAGKGNASFSEIQSLSSLAIFSAEVDDVNCLPDDFSFSVNLTKFDIRIGKITTPLPNEKADIRQDPPVNSFFLRGDKHRHTHIQLASSLLPKVGHLNLKHVKMTPILSDSDEEGALNALKSLFLGDCSGLEYLSRRSSTNAVFANLETLRLKKLVSMKGLGEGVPNPGSFQNLRILEIRKCDQLSGVIPSNWIRNFPKLEQLHVGSCSSVTHIIDIDEFAKELEIAKELEMTPLANIKNLHLQSLKGLLSICKEPGKILSFSNLIELDISDCPTLAFIFSPDMSQTLFHLQKLSIVRCGTLGVIFKETEEGAATDEIRPLKFPKLNKMTVRQCEKLTSLLPIPSARGLVKLKELDISDCKSLTEIFKKTQEGAAKYETLPLKFPELNKMTVHQCEGLESLLPVSIARGLVNLEELNISGCKSLTEIFKKTEAGAATDEIRPLKFPKLNKMTVRQCEQLSSLFPVSIARGLVNLVELYISDCEKLKVLVSRGDSTETEVEANSNEIHWPKLIKTALRGLIGFERFCHDDYYLCLPLLQELIYSGFHVGLTRLNAADFFNLKIPRSATILRKLNL